MMARTLTPERQKLRLDAIRLRQELGWTERQIAEHLKLAPSVIHGYVLNNVNPKVLNNYLHDIDKQLREERRQKVFDMYMACYTQDEIAQVVGVSKMEVSREVEVCNDLEKLPKSYKLQASFSDPEFQVPLYTVWPFAKKTNEISHPGNSEQRILENLLYLFTKPFDIVLDPFAGGGSTIDVCKKRSRR